MPHHTRVFTIEGSSVSNGNTETLTDSDNEDWLIEKIQVVETGGNDINDATATIKVAGTSVTDSLVDVPNLQENYRDLPPMHITWPSNKQFSFDWTNNDGGARTINVGLWVVPISESQADQGIQSNVGRD